MVQDLVFDVMRGRGGGHFQDGLAEVGHVEPIESDAPRKRVASVFVETQPRVGVIAVELVFVPAVLEVGRLEGLEAVADGVAVVGWVGGPAPEIVRVVVDDDGVLIEVMVGWTCV